MTIDEKWMKIALEEANKAEIEGEVPVGAILVKNGKLIARAHNQVERLNDVTAHAEMLAITSAANYLGGKYLENCTMYVTMEPCQMCAGALYWSRISKIYYGAEDPKRGFTALGNLMHPKTKIYKGVLEHECKELLDKFFISRRNLN